MVQNLVDIDRGLIHILMIHAKCSTKSIDIGLLSWLKLENKIYSKCPIKKKKKKKIYSKCMV